ncbi:unnamed protein product [Gadus morhua 'NCC']
MSWQRASVHVINPNRVWVQDSGATRSGIPHRQGGGPGQPPVPERHLSSAPDKPQQPLANREICPGVGTLCSRGWGGRLPLQGNVCERIALSTFGRLVCISDPGAIGGIEVSISQRKWMFGAPVYIHPEGLPRGALETPAWPANGKKVTESRRGGLAVPCLQT